MQALIDAILQKHQLAFSASEAHGIATGMLCLEPNTDPQHWLAALLESEDELDCDEKPLPDLFNRTRALLDPEQGGFDFDLLLPDQERALDEQIDALRTWCQGFLYGLGYSSRNDGDWPGDCREILHDLLELTKLDADFEEDNEENAAALVELQEYVRAAVLTIRDHFLETPSATQH
jgi:uncharacterized protein